MNLNPIEQEILEIFKKDIEKTGKDYSLLTNTEISKMMNISAFTIRDKVLKLAKKKVIVKRTNVWLEGRKFHNRIVYLG